jgi:molybdenum cofactor cytidylyltransferase
MAVILVGDMRNSPEPVPDEHLAIVLAAGGSARLGYSKLRLRRNDETLVHRAARIAAETRPRRLLVVSGAEAEFVAQTLRDVPHEVVHNAAWREGLGSSLRAVAHVVAHSDMQVLLLACDQPALEVAHLQRLLAGARATATGVAATAYEGTVGIPIVVPSHWFSTPEAFAGDAGFRHRLRGLPSQSFFRLEAPELAVDIDLPQDVENAVSHGQLDAGSGECARRDVE